MKKSKKNKHKNPGKVIVATVGIPGEWEPSKKELNKVAKLVVKATKGSKYAVLAIQNGITLSILDI